MNYLLNLDFGDMVSVVCVLFTLLVLIHLRSVRVPMVPETRTFLFKFVENNTGVCWAFAVLVVSMGALFHATHDKSDPAIIEAIKNLMVGAAAWMGALLTGRAGTVATQPPLVAGTGGTRDTTTVLHEGSPAAQPAVPDPTVPLIVQKVIDPVVTKPEG